MQRYIWFRALTHISSFSHHPGLGSDPSVIPCAPGVPLMPLLARCSTFLKAFLEGWLPGAALSIFLMILPPILLWLSKTEGYVAHSEIDRAAAGKHFYFKIVTVFLAVSAPPPPHF